MGIYEDEVQKGGKRCFVIRGGYSRGGRMVERVVIIAFCVGISGFEGICVISCTVHIHSIMHNYRQRF